MSQWFGVFLYLNILFAVIAYLYLYKRRKLIGFHLGMNISMVAGGGIAIATGMILINQFPLHFFEVTVAATLIGIVTGSLFGALFDYQTLLTGYINGLMMGIMSPMIGAAINDMIIILLVETAILVTFVLLILSAKKT
ncbi:hypothetical protein [Litchfieldia alkalitelluris]|uniref:hypothetical protein n=1 Tax=Litchfieldia alkalitelluris TaxID=304268 RepID=UPI00099764AF|nr:hypothetical protein [Litchfieldia alkalitelluris]